VTFPDGQVMEAFAVKPNVPSPRGERQIIVQFGNRRITGFVDDKRKIVYFPDFSLE